MSRALSSIMGIVRAASWYIIGSLLMHWSRLFGMGTSTRPQPDQPGKALYLGKGLDKSNFGIHSPGPMVYGAKSTIGASVNTNSKYGNASAFSFGSEDRFAY